ncbi:MAG: hypothetical protein ACK4PR_08915, partial [Gammaproteobacteria bacterium]
VIKPIAKIGEDMVGYFRPYKDKADFKDHLMKLLTQVPRGLGNVRTGLVKVLLGAPLVLTVGLYHTFKNRSLDTFYKTVKYSSQLFFSGITQAIRGVWQITSIPLAVGSIVSRAICTVIRAKPSNQFTAVKPQVSVMIDACEKILTRKPVANAHEQQLENRAGTDSQLEIKQINERSPLNGEASARKAVKQNDVSRPFSDLARQILNAEGKGLLRRRQFSQLSTLGLFAKDNGAKWDVETTKQLQNELTALKTVTVLR